MDISPQKEVLDAIGIIVKSYNEVNATQIYNGLVIAAVSDLIYEIKVNGKNYNLQKYGTGIPVTNTVVKVFVPRNNWSQAFFMVGNDSDIPSTIDYNSLSNKPSINNVLLSGNKTSTDLSLYGTGNEPPYPVTSVNSFTGAVSLTTDNVPATITNRYVPSVPIINPATTFLNGNGIFTTIASGGATSIGNVYLSNIASTVFGYKTLNYISDPTATEMSVTCTDSADVLSAVYLYTAPLETNVIDAGTWKSTFYLKCSANAGINRLKLVCFVRHTNGTETDLFTTYTGSVAQTTYDYFYTESSRQQFSVLPTDTLGVRVYGSTNRTSSTTIYYQIGGANTSYFNTPLSLRHTQLRDINGDPTYQHIATSINTFPINITTFTYNVSGYIINTLILDSVTKQSYASATLTYNNLTTTINNSLTVNTGTLSNPLIIIITYIPI